MEHIFYKELNLLLIKHEEKKFSLFNVVSGFNTKDGYKTKPVSFLPAFLPTLEVMENAKLILTENKVYTLDGHIVAENFKHDAKISVSKFAQNWKILVCNKHGEVQELGIWDGKEIIGRYQGDNIFFDENNVVVAQKLPSSFSYKFTIYHNGVLQKYSPIGDDVYLFGDTLVCCNDKETVYSIATGEIICCFVLMRTVAFHAITINVGRKSESMNMITFMMTQEFSASEKMVNIIFSSSTESFYLVM